MSTPLPVISLLNSLMTVQAYLRSATATKLPPVITENAQYAGLVTQFENWQQDLWEQFWEGLLSTGITAESTEVNNLFVDGVADEPSMHDILYDGAVPIVVSQADDVANLVTNGQGLLEQLQQIADSIEDADKAQVATLTTLVDQLQNQFAQQEDALTKEALGSATDVVATAVDVMIAVGSEGDAIQPLVKGVIKLGTDAIDELALTDEINQTLGQLESAWEQLDEATTDLTQITLTCNQIQAVTTQASQTLVQLQTLSNNWSTVASTTQQSAPDWSNGGSAALQVWAAQMVKLTFGNATQSISAAAASAVPAARRRAGPRS